MRGTVEVVDAPKIDGVQTLGVHRVLQTVINGKPRTGELYNYVAHFGDYQVIVTANPLVVPDKPVAPVDTQRAGELLVAGVRPFAAEAQRTSRGRNWMLIRGPVGFAVFGIACSQVRWHDPPITSRSPWLLRQPQRRAATARAQREHPRGAQAHDGHHGVLGAAAADGVAVPGDAVVAVAVEAQARRW